MTLESSYILLIFFTFKLLLNGFACGPSDRPKIKLIQVSAARSLTVSLPDEMSVNCGVTLRNSPVHIGLGVLC